MEFSDRLLEFETLEFSKVSLAYSKAALFAIQVTIVQRLDVNSDIPYPIVRNAQVPTKAGGRDAHPTPETLS